MSRLRLLALDTATLTASAAVVDIAAGGGPEILAADDADTGSRSERLMPLIADVMARAGAVIGDIDAIAVGAGPGSFTGLRIGLATAKGLAFATGKPLWLVSSLAALAWSMDAVGDGLCVPVLDARRGELFAGFYRRDSGGVPRAVAPERVMPPTELAAAIATVWPACGGDAVAISGDALVAYGAELATVPDAVRRLSGRTTPSAIGIAVLAAAGDRADGLTAGAPAYLRPSEAEVMYPDGIPGAVRNR